MTIEDEAREKTLGVIKLKQENLPEEQVWLPNAIFHLYNQAAKIYSNILEQSSRLNNILTTGFNSEFWILNETPFNLNFIFREFNFLL